MLNWVKSKLGISELEARMNELEFKVSNLEAHVENSLNNFGSYNSRTKEELVFMNKQINEMLSTIESIITYQEYQPSIEKALRMRRRLKNNQTRIINRLSA